LEKPSLWSLPPITILILMAPSLYLAGLVNAMVMTLLTLGLFAYNPPGTKGVMVVLPVTALLIAISISLTWNPYFQNVMLEQISNYSESRLGIVGMFRAAWEALFSFPIYATFQWVDNSTFTSAIKHADPGILSLKTLFVLRLTGRAYLLQAVFAFAISCSLILISFWKGVSAKGFDLKINYSVAKIIVLSTLFIGLSYTFSAWLGGPAWIKGERPDQLIQFLPMLLFLIFLLPFLFINNGRSGKIISGISFSLLVIFGMINLISGFMIIHDHLQYRGNILTKADVPLIDKMQAIEFIANNWQEHSDSNIIPVDYDLGGGTWDWVADFGLKMEPWYPAPMTDGRGFDYEFLRSYGLTNYQEGIQLRTFGTGRFLITYAFKDPPQVGEQIDHYFFGRLRVSVVER
jgi:hypothetical protein